MTWFSGGALTVNPATSNAVRHQPRNSGKLPGTSPEMGKNKSSELPALRVGFESHPSHQLRTMGYATRSDNLGIVSAADLPPVLVPAGLRVRGGRTGSSSVNGGMGSRRAVGPHSNWHHEDGLRLRNQAKGSHHNGRAVELCAPARAVRLRDVKH